MDKDQDKGKDPATDQDVQDPETKPADKATEPDALLERRQILDCEVKAVGEEGDRTLEFVASDQTEDRVGDVIVQSGWDLKAFRKNGVFLWGHDSDLPALGRPKAAKVEEKRLRVAVRFAPEDAGHDLANLVYRLYREKILSSVSVGFRPLKYRIIRPDGGSEESRDPDVIDSRNRTRYEFLKQELLELSAVNVPANANAVVMNAFAGRFDERTRGQLVEFGFLPADVAELTKDTREALAHQAADAAKASVDRAVEVLQESLDRAERIIEKADALHRSTLPEGDASDSAGGDPGKSDDADATVGVEDFRTVLRSVLGTDNKEK